MTFYALQGKVNHLVITGNSADPISMDQTAPTGSKTLGFNQNIYFGSNITLRNLNYRYEYVFKWLQFEPEWRL